MADQDSEQTTEVQTSESGAAPEVVEAAEAAPVAAPKKRAVVVVAGMTVPDADLKIVTEARSYSGGDDTPLAIKVKQSGYPTGADTYLRYDPEVAFPRSAPEVLTMGVDLAQGGFAGFARQDGVVNVGPAHPAYAAANLAFQRGATEIEIVGLTDAEKEKLRPYFDGLATHAAEPAQVAVSFS